MAFITPLLMRKKNISPPPPQTTIYASDNAYVGANLVSDNTTEYLKTSYHNSIQNIAFVKFDVSNGIQNVSSAILHLYGGGFGGIGPTEVQIYKVNSGTWDEDSITWNNKPTNVSQIGAWTWLPGYCSINITALYNGWRNGTIQNNGIRVGGGGTGVSTAYMYIRNRKGVVPPYITLTP